jgi:hypothetical protein
MNMHLPKRTLLRDLAKDGYTLADAAERAGVSLRYARSIANAEKLSFSSRSSRDDDELALDLLRVRCSTTLPTPQIGAMFGITPERVRVITDRVRKADIAESGEADAANGYKWGFQ